LLSLFYVSNEFYDIFLTNIETEMCETVLTTQMLPIKTFEMSNKFNKFWLKGLNSNISKI